MAERVEHPFEWPGDDESPVWAAIVALREAAVALGRLPQPLRDVLPRNSDARLYVTPLTLTDAAEHLDAIVEAVNAGPPPPDPTPIALTQCIARHPGNSFLQCALEAGHGGRHEHRMGGRLVTSWPNDTRTG